GRAGRRGSLRLEQFAQRELGRRWRRTGSCCRAFATSLLFGRRCGHRSRTGCCNGLGFLAASLRLPPGGRRLCSRRRGGGFTCCFGRFGFLASAMFGRQLTRRGLLSFNGPDTGETDCKAEG